MPPQALTLIALVVTFVAVGLIWMSLFLPGRHQGTVMFTALCLFVAAQFLFHQAKTFWTFRPSRFEYCTNPEQLAARLDTARRLFGLVAARLA
jgi:hypothetical protein